MKISHIILESNLKHAFESVKDKKYIEKTNGWELKVIKGNHHVYMKKGRIERLSVPVHKNKDLKKGLLNAL